MRCAMRLATFIALGLLAVVFPVLAADPSQDDVEIVAYSNGPSCGVPDGSIKFMNNSEDYHYRVTYDVQVKNDNFGEEQCDNSPPSCNGEDCECDIEGTWDLEISAVLQTPDGSGCGLPNCLLCEQHCDNTNDDCDPPSHCTCVYGQFRLTHYSEDGNQWFAMPPSFPTPIEEADLVRPSECPEQGLGPPVCNY